MDKTKGIYFDEIYRSYFEDLPEENKLLLNCRCSVKCFQLRKLNMEKI